MEVLSVEPSAVTKEARFAEDLDADSLDLVELVMALEEEFDVSVDEEELEGVETVQARLRPGRRQALMDRRASRHHRCRRRRNLRDREGRLLVRAVPPHRLTALSISSRTGIPAPYFDNPKEARRSDRFSQFALAATAEALDQAGELAVDPTRIGVLIGTGIGGIGTNEEQIVIRHEKGDRRVSPVPRTR